VSRWDYDGEVFKKQQQFESIGDYFLTHLEGHLEPFIPLSPPQDTNGLQSLGVHGGDPALVRIEPLPVSAGLILLSAPFTPRRSKEGPPLPPSWQSTPCRT
jgi:hypothetical protein